MARNHGSVTTCFALAVLATILLQAPVSGEIQNDLPGFSPNHVFEGALQGENIDIMSGNVSLTIPLGPRYAMNDWFGYQLTLHYNSKVWENECDPSDIEDCPGVFSNPDTYGLGVNLHMGRIQHHEKESSNVFRYQAPSGGTHFIVFDPLAFPPETSTYTTDSNSYYVTRTLDANDSTLSFVIHFGDGRLARFEHAVGGGVRAAGAGWYCTRIETVEEDASGSPLQYVDIEYVANTDKILYIEDKFLRKINFVATATGYKIQFPSTGGEIAEYELVLETKAAQDPHVPDSGIEVSVNKLFLTEVRLPELDVNNFEYHQFNYDTFGSISYWKVPTGAEMFYYNRYFQTSSNKPLNSELYGKKLTVDGETYEWTYTRSGPGVITNIDDIVFQNPPEPADITGSNPSKVRVLDPMNNLTVYRFHYTQYGAGSCDAFYGCKANAWDGLLHEVSTYSGPAENDAYLVKREEYDHIHDGSLWVQLRDVPPAEAADHKQSVAVNMLQERTTTTVPGGGIQPAEVIERESSNWFGAKIRKPRMTKEFHNNELYRYTVTDINPLDDNHNNHSFVETYDKNGTLLTRTNKVWLNNRIECKVNRIDPGTPSPIVACGSINASTGSVATVYTFDAQGNIRLVKTQGGDTNSTRTKEYRYTNGVVASAEVEGWSWYLFHRTVDPDSGLIASSRDSAQTEITYQWDKLGRLKQIAPDSPEPLTSITYDNLLQTTVRQQRSLSNFTQEVYFYDRLGRLIETQRRNRDGGTDSQKTVYDIMGRVLQQSTWSSAGTPDSLRAWTTYEYNLFPNPNAGAAGEPAFLTDPLGRVSRVTRPDGSYTDTAYDGLLTRVTSHGIEGSTGPIASVTEYLNDSKGRLVSVDSPYPGADASYTYDEKDRLTRVELTDATTVQVRSFDYDRLGRLRFASNPENGTVEYQQYDGNGKLISYRDAAGSTFTNVYDDAGRLTSKAVNGQALVLNAYDELGRGAANGKLTTQTSYQVQDGVSALVQTKQLYYGAYNEATPCTVPPTAFLPEPTHSGLNGRVKQVKVKIEPWAQWLTTELCQNDLGSTGLVKYPFLDGSLRTRTQASTRIANGYVWEIADLKRDSEYVAGVDYDPNGAITRIMRGNEAVLDIQRDNQGRPFSYEYWHKTVSGIKPPLTEALGCGANTIPGIDPVELQQCYSNTVPNPTTMTKSWEWGPYSYDGAGNISQIGYDTFKYDALNRLVAADLNNNITSIYELDYQYDAFGNLTQRMKEVGLGGGTFTYNFGVDPLKNRLTNQTGSDSEIYSFDANGNMVSTDKSHYMFGPQNRLHEVWSGSRIAEYWYDAAGYRVRTLTGGIETFYVRDAAGQVLSEYRRAEGETVSPGWDKDYVYGLGQAVSMVKNELPSVLAKPRASNVNPGGLVVTWTASSDPDIVRYKVMRTVSDPQDTNTYFVMGATNFIDSFHGDVTAVAGTFIEYTVSAIDNAFNEGPPSPLLVVRPFDSSPAGNPSTLNAIALDKAVRLAWTAPTDDDIAGYQVWRKITSGGTWTEITTALITTTEWINFGLTNGTEYYYRIVAVDTNGNPSVFATAPEDMAIPVDNVSPAPPFGLKAVPGLNANEIILSWNPNTEEDLGGYTVYRSTDPTLGWPDSWPEGSTTTQITDTVSVTEKTYYYLVAHDTSNNPPSEPSIQVAVTPRDPILEVPTSPGAEFWVDVNGWPSGTLDPWDDCTLEEIHHEITVKVIWGFLGNNLVRVYRSRGGEDDYSMIAEVLGSDLEYIDRNPGYHDYDYFVVSTYGPGFPKESAAFEGVPVNAEDVVDDPNLLFPANIIGLDGDDLGYFNTDNAPSRAVSIEWMPISESQVIGYHVYRKCEWDECGDGGWYSRDHLACENSWVRLTDNPITTGRVYEDLSIGGLSGCFTYAVTAVLHDGIEGIFGGKVLAIDTNGSDGGDLECESQATTSDYDKNTGLPIQTEFDRINAVLRGTGDDVGAPSTPEVGSVTFGTATPFLIAGGIPPWTGQAGVKYARINWDPASANSASDLRGYHIEMAGSYAGPWERLTTFPVAWFESAYFVRGFEIKTGIDIFLPEKDCAHFRVIAVDEDGNESAPGYPTDVVGNPIYPLAGCDPGPTLPAPTNFQVTTNPEAWGCSYQLQWDDTGNVGDEYYVYRYAIPYESFVPYFYVTERVQAQAGNCDGVTCTYVEVGDDVLGREIECPWNHGSISPSTNPCPLSNHLQAFYITIKSPTGGESPRSDIVFWDCNEVPGFAQLDLEPLPGRLSPNDVFGGFDALARAQASFEPGISIAATERLAPESFFEPGVCEPFEEKQWEATGTLLTLGQSSTDPPVEIVDIHVDHLGSTRLTTGNAGGIVTTHDFMPYGEEILPVADSLTKMFTGHERDAKTGLDYMFARYYGSGLARFLSVDPASRSIHPKNTQTWNRYSYVGNNPIRFRDPDGLAKTTAIKVNSDTNAVVTTTETTTDSSGNTNTEVTTDDITVNSDGSVTQSTTTETSSTGTPGVTNKTVTTTTFASATKFAESKGVAVKTGKFGADLSDISAASLATVSVVAGAAKDLGLPSPVITSGRDGKHDPAGFHYTIPSKALDYRGNNIKDASLTKLANMVGSRLGSAYDSVAEFFSNPDFDHLHVEYDP